MRYLILSDIHANLEAQQAVLEDARGQYDRILCLGDLVGYGAEPNQAVEWARQSGAVVIRGNHDRVSAQSDLETLQALENFNPAAQAAARWTRDALLPQNREFLQALPRGPLPYEGADLVHGSPVDEDEYLITAADAASVLPYMGARLTFFGHTHRQGGFRLTRRSTAPLRPERTLEIEPDYFYLVNPGSVGQPRDGDPRAAYALYLPLERTVEFRRVAYDIDGAAKKIRAAGLPDWLAARLHQGI